MDVGMNIKMGPSCFDGIVDLDKGRKIDEKPILEICDYVRARFDCADFRMVCLIRTLYAYQHLLNPHCVLTIRDAVLGFKYWMDEPGEDSMCYWSENHQVLFATVEYLAGQLYPEEIFENSGMTGKAHLEKAGVKLLRWMKYRFEYGFTEWHSNTYYEEDISPLALLIDFCDNEEIVLKAKMILDLLLLDMAMHSYRGLFSATSGRCYEKQKKHPLQQNTLQIGEWIWKHGNVEQYDYSRISSSFLLMKNYEVPEVIRLIGKDTKTVEIKDSMGLDLSEVKGEFADPDDFDTTGMFLWAMESFTNTESISLTMKIFNAWKLYHNNFLKDLQMVNIPVLQKLRLLPLLVKLLNPVTQGVAIQRANSYTYKTEHYMLSTAQKYHPGEFGDQQHVWQATLSKEITVFTTHPGSAFFSDVERNFSPSYWVGNGILPHASQHRNVVMAIYKLNKRKGFMEKPRAQFTHAYFPQEQFDEVVLKKNYLFGRLGEVYLALIGRYPFRVNDSDPADIIQDGKETYWICELGTQIENGSFEAFCDTVLSRAVTYSKGTLTYAGNDMFSLTYKKSFTVNGKIIQTDYARYETPYVSAERKPKEITVLYQGKKLHIDFENQIRELL